MNDSDDGPLRGPILSEISRNPSPKKDLPPLVQYPKWSRNRRLSLESNGSRPSTQENLEEFSEHITLLVQIGKKNSPQLPELSALGGANRTTSGSCVSTSSNTGDATTSMANARMGTHLDQAIRFLQEQHQLMLSNLQQEVEQLRQRNRDLQFQLVFTKGSNSIIQSSPSSPEDDSKPQLVLSPKQLNVTPLQVEILEREIIELKSALQESRSKNSSLNDIIEDQKRRLESGNRELEAFGTRILHPATAAAETTAKLETQNQPSHSKNNVETNASPLLEDLEYKLEEADKVIRKLRRENDEQRRELMSIKTNLSKSANRHHHGGPNGNGGGSNNGRGGHHRAQNQHQQQRFPPLHTQSYWHHGGQHHHRNIAGNGMEYVAQRHSDGKDTLSPAALVGRAAPSLPHLRGNAPHQTQPPNAPPSSANSSTSGVPYVNYNNGNPHGNSHGHHQRRGGYNNGNHYYRVSKEEKFRGNGGGNGSGNQHQRPNSGGHKK